MANLIDVARELGTEEQCLAYLEAMRWPGGVACLKCGSVKVVKTVSSVKARRGSKAGQVVKPRYVYDCLEPQCGHQFTATTGTIFHDTHLPLSKWFMAVALIVDAKKSVSALQMQRHLGIGSYKTAWHLCHRIRRAMEQNEGMFRGTVEVDETYIGGRFDKRRKRGPYEKQAVVGMVQRSTEAEHSKVKSFPVAKPSSFLLTGAVRDNVSTDAEMICTDESTRYKALESDYRRTVVNHIRKEYAKRVDGLLISTNGIENFWSLFKRALVGQHHSVSVKHLSRYLDESVYKFNNRRAANVFALTVARMVNSTALPYADLTASE